MTIFDFTDLANNYVELGPATDFNIYVAQCKLLREKLLKEESGWVWFTETYKKGTFHDSEYEYLPIRPTTFQRICRFFKQ